MAMIVLLTIAECVWTLAFNKRRSTTFLTFQTLTFNNIMKDSAMNFGRYLALSYNLIGGTIYPKRLCFNGLLKSAFQKQVIFVRRGFHNQYHVPNIKIVLSDLPSNCQDSFICPLTQYISSC